MSEPANKLHVDSDWKAQAEAERARLREAETRAAEAQTSRPRDADGLPPADFRSLVGVLASQAVMGLGGYADPQSGKVMVDLAGARFAIDLLGTLEAKCAGNLSAEESEELKLTLGELRARFVQIAALIAKQSAASAAQPSAASGSKGGPSLIVPG